MATSVSQLRSKKTQSKHRDTELMKLMKSMGVETGRFEPMPADQITTFILPSYAPVQRVIAWVQFHTICYEGTAKRSVYCVDKLGNKLQQKDCARELGLDRSVVSRHMAYWERRGLIKMEEDEDGDIRIRLCGEVVPVEIETSGQDEALPTSLREALESLDPPARQTLHDEYLAWQVRRREETAAAMASALKKLDQELAQLMLTHGLSKVGRRWTVAVQQVNPSPDAAGAVTSDSPPSCLYSNSATAEMASGSPPELLVQQLSPPAKEPKATGSDRPPVPPVPVQQVSPSNMNGSKSTSDRHPVANGAPIGGQGLEDRRNGIPLSTPDLRSSDPPIKYASDRDELLALINSSARGAWVLDRRAERAILDALDAPGQNLLRAFIENQTRVIARLQTPVKGPGYWIRLAQRFGSRSSGPSPAPRVQEGKCPKCKLGALPNGDPCSECKTGKDLQRKLERKRAQAGAASGLSA
jgi:hypothetical protein